MQYINLPVSVIDGPEFKGARADQQGAWLCLQRFACGQEAGGTIIGCREWSERMWQTVVGVEKGLAMEASPLWDWSDSDLRVKFYQIDLEKLVRSKRRGGRLGNQRRWGKKTVACDSHTESDSDSHIASESHFESDSDSVMEGKVKECNVKEGAPPCFEVVVPSLEEFVAACVIRGVPAWYAELRHARRSERPQDRWPHGSHWQSAVTTTFNEWRADGAPMEPGGGRNGHKKNAGVWELQQRLQALREREENHPANEGSSAYAGEPSTAELDELEEIRKSINEVNQQISKVREVK